MWVPPYKWDYLFCNRVYENIAQRRKDSLYFVVVPTTNFYDKLIRISNKNVMDRYFQNKKKPEAYRYK